MLRSNMIDAGINAANLSSAEFKAESIVDWIVEHYRDDVHEFSALLVRNALKREIASRLKKASGQDPQSAMQQLALAGFGNIPQFIPFVSNGDRSVSYISAMSATFAHVESSIALREKNYRFASDRLDEMRRLRDFMLAHGGEDPGITVYDCIQAAE